MSSGVSALPESRVPAARRWPREILWSALFVFMASPAFLLEIPAFAGVAWLFWLVARWVFSAGPLFYWVDPPEHRLERTPLRSPAGQALGVLAALALSWGVVIAVWHDTMALNLLAAGLIAVLLYLSYSKASMMLFGRFTTRFAFAAHDFSHSESVGHHTTLLRSDENKVRLAKVAVCLNLTACIAVLGYARMQGVEMGSMQTELSTFIGVVRHATLAIAVGLPLCTTFLAPFLPRRREIVIYAVSGVSVLAALYL